jgi:5,6,7,8-tetrahydromethanopterin hydro-lyase
LGAGPGRGADAVAEGVIPESVESVDGLALIAAVRVTPKAQDADLVYRNNREDTRTALANGWAGLPKLDEVLTARQPPANPFFQMEQE